MKRFAAVTLAALMVLTVFASAASAADTNTTKNLVNTIEIRGPVYNGSSLPDILTNQGTNGVITMDATKFAAFFYDIDNNVTTETLAIKQVTDTKDNVIGKNGLVYQTTIGKTDYEYEGWGNYSVLGFFADKYIPLKSNDASKLAKLILDSDDKYTLKTGEKLDLGQGYSLQAKQVDVDGEKVWLEFDKDGQYVDDQIVSTTNGSATWTCEVDDVQDEDDVPVLKVRVNQVFQGAVDSIAQVEGLWLIDYANAMKIESDDEFGKLDNTGISGPTITITNEDTITLSRDSDIEIGQGMYFKVADTPSNVLRFYAFKEIKDAGTHEIRGSVATGPATWTADNFAGFFYDLKDNVKSETLAVNSLSGNVIQKDGLVYTTTIQKVDYDYDSWGQYPVIGFFAEKYVPLKSGDASKLAKLVIDSNDKYTLKTGEKLDLGQGYSLQAKQVDVDGEKVWLEFDKDGQYVDDQIISTTDKTNGTWSCEVDDIQDEDDVVVLKVHVNQVFQGAVDSIAQIEGLWLIDYANAMKIESDDEFGKFDNTGISGATITIKNEDTVTLNRNSDIDLGQGMFFKVADTPVSDLRYYPYVEKTIGNVTVAPGGVAPTNVTNVTAPTNVTNVTAPVAGVNETAPVSGEAPVTGEKPTANNTTAPTKEGAPGFGIFPAILGLLVVVYLVRKNR